MSVLVLILLTDTAEIRCFMTIIIINITVSVSKSADERHHKMSLQCLSRILSLLSDD